MDNMESQAINLRKIQRNANLLPRRCVARAVDGGYVVLCDGAVLNTVNGHKPRVFGSLDTVLRKLKEMGITEFEVVAEN